MLPVEDWFVRAICHDRNPGVWVDAACVLHVGVGEGAATLGRHAEGCKFHFRLSCRRHYSYCTPHAVTGPNKLLCRACEPPARLRAAPVQPWTSLEQDMHQHLGRLGLDTAFAAQVKLPFWHGQLDFWHAAAGLAVQVDGPRHFAGGPTRVPPAEQQRNIDAAMIAAAWAAGVGLVRVRYWDVGSAAAAAALHRALEARAAAPGAPILVLSPGFQPSMFAPVTGERDPWAFLCDTLNRLHTPAINPTTEIDCFSNIVFTPRPPGPRTV